MKKFLKFFIAFFTATALIFTATSCNSDSDSNDDDSIVFKASEDGVYGTYKFYADKTFVCHAKYSDVASGITFNLDLDFISGTYTGDPATDGTVTLTATKEADLDSLEDTTSILSVAALLKGETNISITNKELPLRDITPKTKIIVISGGKFTAESDDGETITYTRQ